MRGQSTVFQALRATMAQEPQPPIPDRAPERSRRIVEGPVLDMPMQEAGIGYSNADEALLISMETSSRLRSN